MRVSTFFAPTLPQAMAQVREALGPKAIVLSWRNTRGGVEISASVQAEERALPPIPQSEFRPPRPAPAADLEPRGDVLANHFKPDDFLPAKPRLPRVSQPPARGLAALVERQAAASDVKGASPFPVGRTNSRSGPLVKKNASVEQPQPLIPSSQKGIRGRAFVEEAQDHGATGKDQKNSLVAFLVRAGLTQDQAQAFATITTSELRRALSDSIAKALTFDPIAAIPPKPLILVGPPGSGKSTCAAKLAARTIATGHEVLLISADSERCGGAEQLQALAKRLGARFETVTTLTDLNELVGEARGRGMVALIDAPSACPAQPADMRATARMISETRLEAVLCCPADMRCDDMEELAAAYQALGVKRAIATRLDLTTRRASVLHALKSADIALAQVSATPYISGGVAIASAARIASLLLEPFEDALFNGNQAVVAA